MPSSLRRAHARTASRQYWVQRHRLGRGVVAHAQRARVSPESDTAYEDGSYSMPPGLRAEAASEEFHQLCNYQLKFLSGVLALRGELVASVYIRAGHSLHSGALELSRVASTPSQGPVSSDLKESILIGGVGSKLTEERVIAQSTMSLPRRGHVVLPLASNSFLVGLLVLEGFRSPERAPAAEHLSHFRHMAAHGEPPMQDGGSVALECDPELDRKRGEGRLFEPATHVLSDVELQRLLLLTAGVLSGGCAMELRSVLLVAAQALAHSTTQATLQEMSESTATMRTIGEMLLPRLQGSPVEESMASAILVQGTHAMQLARELEDALQPLAPQATGPSVAASVLLPRAQQAPPASRQGVPQGFEAAPGPGTAPHQPHKSPVDVLRSWDAACEAPSVASSDLWPQMPPTSAGAPQRAPPTAAHSTGLAVSSSNSADDAASWLVLRSIDDTEEAGLMSEGDALCFGESDAWRPNSQPVELKPRPVRRIGGEQHVAGGSEEVPEAHSCGGEHTIRSHEVQLSADAQVQSLGCAVEPKVAVVASVGSSGEGGLVTHGRCEQLCSVLDVVAQAIVPVKKLCDAVGVELVLLSSALLATVDRLLLRRARDRSATGALPVARGHSSSSESRPVIDAASAGTPLIRVSSVDSAHRAISHVLDAALQRTGKRGRVLVDIHSGSEASQAIVRVTVADTGIAMLPEALASMSTDDDAWGSDSAGRCAVDAMQSWQRGLPVGSGAMGLRVAERFMSENGGSLTVGRWLFEDEEYVRTTVTFLSP